MSEFPTEGAPPSWFMGTIMQAMFTTEKPINELLPSGLHPKDSHAAFLKVYQMKHGPLEGPVERPSKGQYLQVCVGTMAAPDGRKPRHYNLMMWGSNYGPTHPGQPGWNKEPAQIAVSWLIRGEERFYADRVVPYMVDVSIDGSPVVTFDGRLDHVKAIDLPPMNGFYVRGYDRSEVLYLPLRDATLGVPVYGSSASISFHSRTSMVAEWNPELLGAIECRGFGVQDVMFLRNYDELERV